MTASLILVGGCIALAYFSFRRNRDAPLAIALGVMVFGAFLAGSLLSPVHVTSKKTSHELTIAENVQPGARVTALLDQQALDNLPNITLPAHGNIDFVAIKNGGRVTASKSPTVTRDEQIELRGWLADPVAQDAAGGLFLILNETRRLDYSSGYGLARPDVSAFLKNPRLTDTGFVIDVPASLLRPGVNELQLGVVASDQRGFFKFPDRVTVTLAEPRP